MSLTSKSPITARQRAANRLSALESTGPRTTEGKSNSRFNALTHGLCARPFRAVMRDLGEDPEEFDRFHGGLIASAEPGNPLEAQLVEDLALLWWKKRRSERAQTGVQVREVERLMVARQRELHDVERLTMDQPAEEAHETGLLRAKDCRGKFEMALDLLDTVVARLERNRGWEECELSLKGLYGPKPTLRGAMVLDFFRRLREGEEELPNEYDEGAGETESLRAARGDLEKYADEEEAEPGLAADADAPGGDFPGQEFEASTGEPGAAPDQGAQKEDRPSGGGDTSSQEHEASAGSDHGPGPSRTFSVRAALVMYLLEERKEMTEEYELFLREHAEVSDAARDACLAPTDPRWTWILRMDNYLDRQLERKLRLLEMLQEQRRKREAASRAALPPSGAPPSSKVKNRSLQVIENTMMASGITRAKQLPGRAVQPLSGAKGRHFVPGG
jgi:hypothetical protein